MKMQPHLPAEASTHLADNLEKSDTCVWPLRFENWGRIAYLDAWQKQKELLEARIAGKIEDTIVFCEHDPVITLGRGALRAEGPQVFTTEIPVLEIERGGLATYHGPGQLVAYPILKIASGGQNRASLPFAKRGVHNLIRALELWTIEYLTDFGLQAKGVEGKTGVWIDGQRKIASIGIAARHWVSYHGIAINLDTGPKPWRALSPCGFSSNVMTDLKTETGKTVSFEEAVAGFIQKFSTLALET